jgi:AcrR family transcriptional regulator
MAENTCKAVDPRIRRTRQLLQEALAGLLEGRDFEELSVQDIAEAATVNRATFYDHYADKFALLECMVASRFHELLAERGVKFDGTCFFALKAITLGVCDFLAGTLGTPCGRQRRIEPHLELAVISVVRSMILDGLKKHASANGASPEMIAATVSWAIYGGAKEWVQSADRGGSEVAAEMVMRLVFRILSPAQAEVPVS